MGGATDVELQAHSKPEAQGVLWSASPDHLPPEAERQKKAVQKNHRTNSHRVNLQNLKRFLKVFFFLNAYFF